MSKKRTTKKRHDGFSCRGRIHDLNQFRISEIALIAPSSLQILSIVWQNLVGVVFGLDFLGADNPLHDAILVDDEGGAEGAEVFAAIHAFFSPDTKLLH